MLKTRIRELRTERGWTLQQLADRAGVSVSYLSEIETHIKTVNSRRLEQLAKAFGVAPHDLLENQEQREDIAAMVTNFAALSDEDRMMVARMIEGLARAKAGE